MPTEGAPCRRRSNQPPSSRTSDIEKTNMRVAGRTCCRALPPQRSPWPLYCFFCHSPGFSLATPLDANNNAAKRPGSAPPCAASSKSPPFPVCRSISAACHAPTQPHSTPLSRCPNAALQSPNLAATLATSNLHFNVSPWFVPNRISCTTSVSLSSSRASCNNAAAVSPTAFAAVADIMSVFPRPCAAASVLRCSEP